MLVPRKPFAVVPERPRARAASATRSATPFWHRYFSALDQDFLSDNQLSLWVRRDGPGLKAFHFYPLPFPHTFTEGKWNFDEIMNRDSLRGTGPSLALQASATKLRFRPDGIEKRMRVSGGTILERCAVSLNTIVVEWELTGITDLRVELGLPHYAASLADSTARGGKPVFVLSVRDQLFAVVAVAGMRDVSAVETPSTAGAHASFAMELRGRVSGRSRVCVALSIGYDRARAVSDAREAAARPGAIFSAAGLAWDRYFNEVVPRFQCSNHDLESLYYYQAYVTRANLYDIPFQPYTHPYTCPWKTGAVWQWSWNTPMNSVAERWLNNKELGAGGILLEGVNGGALNIGSYLHPVERQTLLRDRHEFFLAQSAYLEKLPGDFKLEAASTLPHTAPNGLLGAWEHYLCSRDLGQLRGFLEVMLEAERMFSARELPSGLYSCYFVDEYDYSLRWKPYTRDFKKGDPTNMFRVETAVAAVDYNCYLYALRKCIVQAMAALAKDAPVGVDVAGIERRNALLKDAINRHLWDEESGFYEDAHPVTLERSGIKCIAGFSALYAGVASASRAERLAAHLRDPGTFGTPYPCPSISMDTPEVDPSIITYGGDSMITSGIWFTTVGLARYGYRELAASFIARTVEMMCRGGPSSSYSYHSQTGLPNQPRHTLAAQSLIVTDLICRYVVGVEPESGGGLKMDPFAREALGVKRLRFGPYRYGSSVLTVTYDAARGHRVELREGPRAARQKRPQK